MVVSEDLRNIFLRDLKMLHDNKGLKSENVSDSEAAQAALFRVTQKKVEYCVKLEEILRIERDMARGPNKAKGDDDPPLTIFAKMLIVEREDAEYYASQGSGMEWVQSSYQCPSPTSQAYSKEVALAMRDEPGDGRLRAVKKKDKNHRGDTAYDVEEVKI